MHNGIELRLYISRDRPVKKRRRKSIRSTEQRSSNEKSIKNKRKFITWTNYIIVAKLFSLIFSSSSRLISVVFISAMPRPTILMMLLIARLYKTYRSFINVKLRSYDVSSSNSNSLFYSLFLIIHLIKLRI